MRAGISTHSGRRLAQTGRRGIKLFAVCFVMSASMAVFPQAASVPYGQAGGWVVLKMPQGRCWMASGRDTSLYGISLDKAGKRTLLFSSQNQKRVKSFPGQISFKDTFVGGQWQDYRATFTLLGSNGQRDTFYETPIGDDIFKQMQTRRFLSITATGTVDGEWFQVSEAYQLAVNSEGLALLRQCAASLS